MEVIGIARDLPQRTVFLVNLTGTFPETHVTNSGDLLITPAPGNGFETQPPSMKPGVAIAPALNRLETFMNSRRFTEWLPRGRAARCNTAYQSCRR